MQSRLVPLDLLFAPAKGASGSTADGPLLPVVSHVPMMALFRFLIQRKGSLAGYWQWYLAGHDGVAADQKEHLAQWRRKVRRLRWLPGAPRPVVSELSRDRLILADGIEQACLAKALDKRWIRVDMPDAIAQQWDVRSVSTLRDVVKQTRRKIFYNPVLHANYRRARVGRPDSIRLDRIRRLLGACGQGLRGLDIGCNMGYMCHMLQRQGFSMTGVDFNEPHLAVARALNETYRLDVNFLSGHFEQIQLAESYDVVVMLTVLYHTFNRSLAEAARIVNKIDGLAPHLLLWESGDRPKQEIDLIRANCGLNLYLPLGATFATGKHRELGAFLRPGTALSKQLLAQYDTELAWEFDPLLEEVHRIRGPNSSKDRE